MRQSGVYRQVLLGLCVALLAGRALWVGAEAARHQPPLRIEQRGQTLSAAYHAQRYATLQAYLPMKRGIIGFAAEGIPPAEQMTRYHLARYALAPLVITHSTDSGVIIADFPNQQALLQYVGQHGFHISEFDSATGLAILLNPERHAR